MRAVVFPTADRCVSVTIPLVDRPGPRVMRARIIVMYNNRLEGLMKSTDECTPLCPTTDERMPLCFPTCRAVEIKALPSSYGLPCRLPGKAENLAKR